MKINTKQTFTEYDGTPITKAELNEKTGKAEQKPIILREFLTTIINAQLPGETTATAEDLNKRDQMSRKLYASNEPDLTLSERTYILERLPKVYPSPRMYGLIQEVLDPEKSAEASGKSSEDIPNTVPVGENTNG